jgi:hypothetical protein
VAELRKVLIGSRICQCPVALVMMSDGGVNRLEQGVGRSIVTVLFPPPNATR